jgi:hypothetical protein
VRRRPGGIQGGRAWLDGCAPGIADSAPAATVSCGYWRKSNGLRPRQRPGGRRYSLPLSWAFRSWGSCCRGRLGGKVGKRVRVPAGHGAGIQSAQDCESFRIYADDQRSRQDSNLRTRLRRGLLCTLLACGNALAGVVPGRVPGAEYGGVSGQSAPGPSGETWSLRPSLRSSKLVGIVYSSLLW